MGKTHYVKKNCEHEYKEIDYQLKKKIKKKGKRKKETWYLQPGKENPVKTFTSYKAKL